MTSVQETHIEGDPTAITELATFLRSNLGPAVSALAQSFTTTRRDSANAWSGTAADAFHQRMATAATAAEDLEMELPTVASWLEELATALEEAQQEMAGAVAYARNAGLTVTGTQIHRPISPQLSTTASADQSKRVAAAYANLVQAWDWCVDAAASAFTRWSEALRDLEDRGVRFSGTITGIFVDLLMGATKATGLAITGFNLIQVREFHAQNAANFNAHVRDLTVGGRATGTPAEIHRLMGQAEAATDLKNQTQSQLKAGVRLGSKLSRGLHVVGAVGTVYSIHDDIQQGESVPQAVTSNVGGMAAGMASAAAAGTITGLAVGSFAAPPIGTVVGAAVGAVVGVTVGLVTSGMIDHAFESASATISSAAQAGWDEVTDTLSDIGDLASGAWNALFG